MTFDAWMTLLVTSGIFISLVMNWGAPDILFIGGTAVLALLGIITSSQATAGFANSGVLTVGAMFVVAAGMRETGVLDYLGQKVLGKVKLMEMELGTVKVKVMVMEMEIEKDNMVK